MSDTTAFVPWGHWLISPSDVRLQSKAAMSRASSPLWLRNAVADADAVIERFQAGGIDDVHPAQNRICILRKAS
ncbi:hypothetical protein GV67_14620 [Pseudorhizobium pelagicum]|uniref:Uncharacterized protein n=1 Tax=Pseudorhizobium pelagicum TaxID=1509405 RepID=A0A922P3F0_9HYPH|nr:hypothetical protein GV67_14620 [Pseudorhizobium pelagicum]KEQ10645.1 hypothetical protein GV68_10320 [Pseudorhizobium pelagicum]